ncbi:MAG: DUF1460 domain-containing protein [Gammaproteobacteria bacterium]|nr:DUF1460 domain-containing protein [Gammaproteobacteria bacterium]
MKQILFFFFVWLCFICENTAFAATVPVKIIPEYSMQTYNSSINSLYQNPGSHTKNFQTRLAFDSAYFFGKPYSMFPAGEGPTGDFDKNPLYRTDVFDCLTYVNTVIALTDSNNLSQFQKKLAALSYEGGQISFLNRNHFVTGDWNESNAAQGFITDITKQIKNAQGISPMHYAVTWIDKPNWYRKMSPKRICLFSYPGDQQAVQLLQAFRAQAGIVKPVKVSTPYIPVTAFLNAAGQVDPFMINQIPTGSVIEIVRPNWDLTALIGTHINVSHLGLVIKTKKGLMFREASLDKHSVIEIPLADYLAQLRHIDPTAGVNIQLIKG